MKKILIIYPHWPPSNLVGTLRPRFIANHLKEFGWQPYVLTVNPEFYEGATDSYLLETVSKDVFVEYVDAKPVKKIRIIGDIGLRAFKFLKKRALEIIINEKIDFVWISIPSFYTALLGNYLFKKTGVNFGIDYQDPWVRSIKHNVNLRSILSLIAAVVLEPFAVRNVSLISGVSENYYKPVLEKYFKTKKPISCFMPVGFEASDYEVKIKNFETLWDNIDGCIPFLYTGAFLPNSVFFIEKLFKVLKKLVDQNQIDDKIRFIFVGTGEKNKPVKHYAQKYGVDKYVIEKQERISYLQVLNMITKATGLLIIGSTEKHYSASKTFQSLLSTRPIFSILHNQSSAYQILNECNAVQYSVQYFENDTKENLFFKIETTLKNFIENKIKWNPDLSKLEKYSANQSAKILVENIEKVLK